MLPLITALGFMVAQLNGSTPISSDIGHPTTTQTVIEQPLNAPITNQVGEPSFTEIKSLIRERSDFYKVSYEEMYSTIRCESHFRNIQSGIYKNGIREDSWGIVQIHLPSHPNITKDQALDISFAVDFMAQEFSKGNQWKWSCYNLLFKT